MKLPGGIKTKLEIKEVRIALAAILCLLVIFVLLSTVFANKAKKQLKHVYSDIDTINAQLICGQKGSAPGQQWYDAFYTTSKYPETYLARTAQQKGYFLSSDLALVASISKPGADKNPQNLPYNEANYYLTAKKSGSEFKINIYQAGKAKLWCGGDMWNKTMPVDMNHPIIEIKSIKYKTS